MQRRCDCRTSALSRCHRRCRLRRPRPSSWPTEPGMGAPARSAATCVFIEPNAPGASRSYYALHDRGALQPSETLVVLGASGGVGLAAVQLGKACGARVIACASSAEKLELCRLHPAQLPPPPTLSPCPTKASAFGSPCPRRGSAPGAPAICSPPIYHRVYPPCPFMARHPQGARR